MEGNTENKELNALISLLDEPNNIVFDTIRNRIYSYGREAIPSLERAWENSFENLIQERIENIIRSIQLTDLGNSIHKWVQGGGHDLAEAFVFSSTYQYPDQDVPKITKGVASIVQDVWLELNNDLTALEKVKVINHILFDIHGFSANKSSFYAPENFFVKNVLETRKGNPMSLGILYAIIAQSLKIPIYGVNLPKHFILAYTDEITELGFKIADENEVLFYINPFNKGAVFTKNEIDLYIKQLKIDPKEEFYKPCDNTTIIKRLFTELQSAYHKSGYAGKSLEIGEFLKFFENL